MRWAQTPLPSYTAVRRLWFAAVFMVIVLPLPAFAQDEPAEAPEQRLPDPRVTNYAIAFEGQELRFEATAGALTLTNEAGKPEADMAFVAYSLKSEEPSERPVTFALNGGPGAASAYLHLGVLGPWILPMEGERIVPSQPIALIENPETWLAFTDLVFIDPVGTGFSRLVEPSEGLRERYLSVEGDVEALARFVAQWLVGNGRIASPKYFVGESYGGFRGPLLAETLQTRNGMAMKGAVLLSPVLDFGWWSQPEHSPMPFLSRLPSLAAAEMERRGSFSPERLRAAEDYASGPFVADFLRGLKDRQALERLVDGVAEATGLPRELLRDHEGRLDMQAVVEELGREEGRIASPYDTSIMADAPLRGRRQGRAADPVLDAMTAPLTSAMLAHYGETLEWLPERPYRLLNRQVSRAWGWGRGRSQPEAVGALQRVLALDPTFRVLIAHGYTDLVTPYFASKLILRQLRPFEPPGRVRQENYRGGHMFYTRPDPRRAFRDAARRLYRGE